MRKPKTKAFKIEIGSTTAILNLPFGFAVGVFYPMVPDESDFSLTAFERYVWYGHWIKDISGWECYCWQFRFLWFAFGRCIPVQEDLEYDE